MRKIFIALCTMVSVITGNAQNTPIGENIEAHLHHTSF